MRALGVGNFKNFKVRVRINKEAEYVACFVNGFPYLEVDIVKDVLSPLQPYLLKPEKYSLAKVKAYSDNVAAFKLNRLFGLTWYVIISPRQSPLLTTYVPSFEEIKNWDTRIVWD